MKSKEMREVQDGTTGAVDVDNHFSGPKLTLGREPDDLNSSGTSAVEVVRRVFPRILQRKS